MNEISPPSNSSSGSGIELLRERIVSLEMLVMHLQNESETLGKVLLDQQRQLDQFRTQLDTMGVRIDEALMEPDVRDPQLERPPHY